MTDLHAVEPATPLSVIAENLDGSLVDRTVWAQGILEELTDHGFEVRSTLNQSWLVWSNEHGAWWAARGMGYTRVLSEAGRFSKAEADRIVSKASMDGAFHITRETRRGERVEVPPEVAVPAPEETK